MGPGFLYIETIFYKCSLMFVGRALFLKFKNAKICNRAEEVLTTGFVAQSWLFCGTHGLTIVTMFLFLTMV